MSIHTSKNLIIFKYRKLIHTNGTGLKIRLARYYVALSVDILSATLETELPHC